MPPAPHGKVHPGHLHEVRRGPVPALRPGTHRQVFDGHVRQTATIRITDLRLPQLEIIASATVVL